METTTPRGHIPTKLATALIARASTAPILSWSLGGVGHTNTHTHIHTQTYTFMHAQIHIHKHTYTWYTPTTYTPVECLKMNAAYSRANSAFW